MSPTRPASSLRITSSMPFSICSMVSPMRSASRAALASASPGVVMEAASRKRGPVCRRIPGDRQQALGQAREGLGEAEERRRDGDVEEHVEIQHLPARVRIEARDELHDPRQHAAKTRQPAAWKRKLPSATRRPPPAPLPPATTVSSPEPRLAPSTRQRATGTETTLVAANVAQSRTTARLENAIITKPAPISMSSIGSPESVEKRTRTPWAWVMGWVAAITSWSASSIRPRPIATRPICPARVSRRERKKITPKRISSGESHARSSEKTCAMSAVPTSAPEHDRERDRQREEALVDERGGDERGRVGRLHHRGHAEPGQEGGAAARHALGEHAAQVGAEHAQHAAAHDVRAPHEEGDAGEEVEEGLQCGSIFQRGIVVSPA